MDNVTITKELTADGRFLFRFDVDGNESELSTDYDYVAAVIIQRAGSDKRGVWTMSTSEFDAARTAEELRQSRRFTKVWTVPIP